MAFDFLRKKKKYPRNQAAEPSGPAPDREMEDAQSARMAKLAKRLQAESEAQPVRLYAGPPRRDPRANLVYAGAPPQERPPVPVYAGPPSGIRRHAPQAVERGVSRRLYAGPPPMDDDSHPPLDVYAGPPSRDDDYDPRRSRMDPVYAGPPPRDDEEDEEPGKVVHGPVPPIIYAGPPPWVDEEDEENGPGSASSLIYAGPEDFT